MLYNCQDARNPNPNGAARLWLVWPAETAGAVQNVNIRFRCARRTMRDMVSCIQDCE